MKVLHLEVEVAQECYRIFLQSLNQFQEEIAGVRRLAFHRGWWQGSDAENFFEQLLWWTHRAQSINEEGLALVTRLKREIDEWIQAAAHLEPLKQPWDGEKPPLFAIGKGDSHPIDPDDLAQGNLGDCYLIASMAAIAWQNPDFFLNHIRDNGDGTYTVTFYKDGKPVEVTVTAEDFQGLQTYVLDQGELWPLVYEKAYAKLHGGYDKIEGGWMADALETMTGVPSQIYNDPAELSINEMHALLEQGAVITVATFPESADRGVIHLFGRTIDLWPFDPVDHEIYSDSKRGLVFNHAYWVSEVNVEANKVILRNPWGWDKKVEIPYNIFIKVIRRVDVNPVTKSSN